MQALQKDGLALQFASHRLRDDAIVVQIAYAQTLQAIKYVSERLQKEFLKDHASNAQRIEQVKAFLQEEPQLPVSSQEVQAEVADWDDEDFVLENVKKDGNLLAKASERLRDDEEIVLAAVQNQGISLRFASERLQDDQGIALKAVRQNGQALEYCSEQ